MDALGAGAMAAVAALLSQVAIASLIEEGELTPLCVLSIIWTGITAAVIYGALKGGF